MDILVEEELPINVQVGSELSSAFPKMNGICQRLSAQLNFQTMTAGWYGEEGEELCFLFSLDISSVYDNNKCLFQAEQTNDIEFVSLSDDVCFSHKKNVNQVNVLIAITEAELVFLKEHTAALKKYLETKIVKVVNLTAKKLNLAVLPTE